ncbi:MULTISPECIES: LWXIA domain-containing protein [Paraburkholderia]|uniref:LWXIA domain-containing protein n=1 Tax=Paraburkholderia TaxID=1822464 RepID=UPI00224E764E|nr:MULTISPECIES: LWXIA domain-containing protein [Paraburkholderia]MCX4161449.1 LWXIA domain-containing protein [Paraburkholderia megapolitana]MDN7156945.1 LWXIA domain-containing protein [Paraburkholderia sp. CHISQ3]MDQ6493990.1 LWXIA domain-containing protein [Paraburkholderia megapolitana]
MLIGPDGRAVPMHYTPPPPPPPPTANDVSTAKQALQKQLGNNAPDDTAALKAAIQKIQQENAELTQEALARAAILLQEQYDASHHQAQNPAVDPIKEAESQVALTHQFDNPTLDAAANALSNSPLATAAPGTSNAAPVSLSDARNTIQSGLAAGLSWQEAVNAARVQFGGLPQNETVLDEAALTIKGDQLESGPDGASGNELNDAAQQLAGLHLFAGASDKAALAALTVTSKQPGVPAGDAKLADSAWATLQKDKAAHASAAQLAQDQQAYDQSLTTELDHAANQPVGGSQAWLTDPSKSDLRWQAEHAVVAANTATGLTGAPTANDVVTSLRAAQIVDTVDAARGAGTPNAAANLKAAQTLTQLLQGASPTGALYQQVMGDARTVSLQQAAQADITGAHGDNPQNTLIAEGNALSSYRNTVLFPELSKAVLASSATQHNLEAVGTPGQLTDIANLLDPLAKASPELAQALYAKLQGKIVSLVDQGPQYIFAGTETLRQMDSYYGPLARIVNDAGGPQSAAAQPVVSALKTTLQQRQTQMTREQNAGLLSTQNPFQPLAYLSNSQLNDPTALYQSLINQDPNSALGKTLMQYVGLKAQPATPKPAADDAGTLATAQAALAAQLPSSGPAPDAVAMQKALAAAQKAWNSATPQNPPISDKTWAEAAIAVQAQADARAINNGTAKAPTDLIAQASGEITADQVFDADTMNSATGALQSGQIADGGLQPKVAMANQTGQPNAAQYLQGLVADGMTMPEAIALTRAFLGGSADSELTLAQAALTAQGAANLTTYYGDPTGPDPIALAAPQLKKMNVIDPATIDLAVNGAPASKGKPAVIGMEQQVTPDMHALSGARHDPGLIDKVNTTYSAWVAAQKSAGQPGSTTAQKDAAATALQQYHAALSAALNAAAGRAPDDSSWQANPLYADTMWQAQNTLETTALSSQLQAAADAGKDSPEYTALQADFTQWQNGLDALQVIAQVQQAQQSAPGSSTDPTAGDVAAAQTLTSDIYGLPSTDPLYAQVMGDPTIQNLQASALKSVTGGAAMPVACTVNGNDDPSVTARLHAEGTRLQAYAGTMLYTQLLDGVANDPTTQKLFSEIHASVFGQKSDEDKLKTLAGIVEGTSPDLAAMLIHQMFPTSGKDATFSPAQLVAWTKNANDLTQVSRIYVAAGGAPNADMTAMRKALETMVTGDENFGKVGYSSRLNTQTVVDEGGAVVWGEDLGFGDVKKSGVQMQLAQDMLDDDPNSDLGVEIARETGFPSLGKPATPVSVNPTGKAAPAAATANASDHSPLVTPGNHLAGLQWQDGMQTATSYDALLNQIGEANGLQTDYAPNTLADEQALALGNFALYNPDDKVFDQNGHATTLGQVAQSLMHGEHVTTPSGDAPVTVASLSGEWWNTRTPGENQQASADFTLLEGLSGSGQLIDVGPADTTVRHGYSDWQSNTGFDKGYLLAQPHWVVDANGTAQMGSAYFVDYKPYDHWYDWDNLKGDLEMGGMIVAGIVALITVPESAPLWMLALSEAADAYFAVTAAMGTINSIQQLSAPGGTHKWTNWLSLAANAFGGAASGLGVLARTGTIMDRVAVGSDAFVNASRVVTVSRDASPLDFARAKVEAQLAGTRAVRGLDDSRLASFLRSRLVHGGNLLGTVDTTRVLHAMQESTAFRLTGMGAMGTNGVSTLMQGYQLLSAPNQASGQDWLNFLTSAGLMASGVGIERIRAGDPDVGAARVQAVNENLPAGVRLLDSGDVALTPSRLGDLGRDDEARIALLTGRRSVAGVNQTIVALRNLDLLPRAGDDASSTGSDEPLTADQLATLNKGLPSGMKITASGDLILGAAKGRDTVAQTAALIVALRTLSGQRERDDTVLDDLIVSPDGALRLLGMPARVALTNTPADAATYEAMLPHIATLQAFWRRVADATTQARQNDGLIPDTWPDETDTALAQAAWSGLPGEWNLHEPDSIERSVVDASADSLTPEQMNLLDRTSGFAGALLDAAGLDAHDMLRILNGEVDSRDAYAILRVLYEQRFNGSREGNEFGINSIRGGEPSVQRLIRRGDVPYWDLTDEQIAAQGVHLDVFGEADDSPFRTADGNLRVRLHYAEYDDLMRMNDKFGWPTGYERGFMTSSLRTVQVETQDGWQLLKFSMPDNEDTFGYSDGNKTLAPEQLTTAVQASDAARAFPDLADEPAGLSLDLGDGNRPITQLWRTLPVAERGYQAGDFVAPLHVFTSGDFANTPLGARFFGTEAGNDGLTPQQQWLTGELAPKLADTLLRMVTDLQVHPMLHEQNVDVVVSAGGRVLDVVVKDLSDVKLDPRAAAVFGEDNTGAPVSALLYDPNEASSIEAQFKQIVQFHDKYLGQMGDRFKQPGDQRNNLLLRAIADRVVESMQACVSADWLANRADADFVEVARNADNQYPPTWRIAAVRELLLDFAEQGGVSATDAARGRSDEAGPTTPEEAAQARVTLFTNTQDTLAATGQRTGGIDADSLAPIDVVGEQNAGEQRERQQRALARFELSNEESARSNAAGTVRVRSVNSEEESRGTSGGARQEQQAQEQGIQQAPAKQMVASAQESSAVTRAETDQAPDLPRAPQAAQSADTASSDAAKESTATPSHTSMIGAEAGQTIARYDVTNAIRVINARFRDLILPSRVPDEDQVALLDAQAFAAAREQAASEGRGSFDETVTGFTVVDGTMTIDGHEVRVVLPASIAPENVGATSPLMHDMLHFAQSPEFVTWARDLNARLNADEQIRANGWFGIDTHEGLTELFNVRLAGGASAPDGGDGSFEQHVYESYRQGYAAILYPLDGAANEAVVARIGEKTAALAYFQADSDALAAYEKAMFDVYRDSPATLLDLRDFVAGRTNGSPDTQAETTAASDDHASAAQATAANEAQAETHAEAEAAKIASRLLDEIRSNTYGTNEAVAARGSRWRRGAASTGHRFGAKRGNGAGPAHARAATGPGHAVPEAQRSQQANTSLDAALDQVLATNARSLKTIDAAIRGSAGPLSDELNAKGARVRVRKQQAYLDALANLAGRRGPQRGESVRMDTGAPLDGAAVQDQSARAAHYQFLRDRGVRPTAGSVTDHIYIGAKPRFVPEVTRYLVETIVDDPVKWRAVEGVEVLGPDSAHTAHGNVIVSVAGNAARERVLDALGRYQRAHPEQFADTIAPVLAEPRLPAISVLARATDAMTRDVNASLTEPVVPKLKSRTIFGRSLGRFDRQAVRRARNAAARQARRAADASQAHVSPGENQALAASLGITTPVHADQVRALAILFARADTDEDLRVANEAGESFDEATALRAHTRARLDSFGFGRDNPAQVQPHDAAVLHGSRNGERQVVDPDMQALRAETQPGLQAQADVWRNPGSPRAAAGVDHVVLGHLTLPYALPMYEYGMLREPEDTWVYALHVDKDKAGDPLTLDDSSVHARGFIRAGSDHIEWLWGHPTSVTDPRSRDELLGAAPQGKVHAVVMTRSTPAQLKAGETFEATHWYMTPNDLPLPDGAIWKDREHGNRNHEDNNVNAAALTAAKIVGNHFAKAEEATKGKKADQTGAGFYPNKEVMLNLGRAPVPRTDPANGRIYWYDMHNHFTTFAKPRSASAEAFHERMGKGPQMPDDGNEGHATFTLMSLPYTTRANAGNWLPYTGHGVAEIASSQHGDFRLFDSYLKLEPEERQRYVPCIVGVEIMALNEIKFKGHRVSPQAHLAMLALAYPEVDRVMIGEVNLDSKELMTGLRGRPLRQQIHPVGYGEMGMDMDLVATARAEILQAGRESGLHMVVHADKGLIQHGRDGLPIRGREAGQNFHKLMRSFMEVGPYDLSRYQKEFGRDFDSSDFVMSDDVIREVVNGPRQRPLSIQHAHMFGLGNWTEMSLNHLADIEWILNHPLLKHVMGDDSWYPVKQGMHLDPHIREEMIALMQLLRIMHGADQVNAQSLLQAIAPWGYQQGLLRELDARDPYTLNQYAGGIAHDVIERSVAGLRWFRYRSYKSDDPAVRAFLDSLPTGRRDVIDDWVAAYERANPGVRDGKQPADVWTGEDLVERAVKDALSPAAPIIKESREAEAIRMLAPAALDGSLTDDEIAGAFDHAKLAAMIDCKQGIPLARTPDPATGAALDPATPAPVAQGPGAPVSEPDSYFAKTHARNAELMRTNRDAAVELLDGPPFSKEDLKLLQEWRETHGHAPLTKRAIEAGRDIARLGGRTLAYQLMAMADIDRVDRVQAENHAAVRDTSHRRNVAIVVSLGASAAAMVALGVVSLRFFPNHVITPAATAAALLVRAVASDLKVASTQINRKSTEVVLEQSLLGRWSRGLMTLQQKRLTRNIPNAGLEPSRVDEAVRVLGETRASALLGQLLPVNVANGEGADGRQLYMAGGTSSVSPRVDQATGVSSGTLEPTNFATRTGAVLSLATAFAYSEGVLNSIHGGLTWSMPALLVGNTLFTAYQLVGGISGLAHKNFTELTFVRKTMNLVGWPAIAAGNTLLTAQSVFLGVTAPTLALKIAEGTMAAAAFGVSYATVRITRVAMRVESIGPRAERIGGVDAPRAIPKLTVYASIGLIGLGVGGLLISWAKHDAKRQTTLPKSGGKGASGSSPTSPAVPTTGASPTGVSPTGASPTNSPSTSATSSNPSSTGSPGGQAGNGSTQQHGGTGSHGGATNPNGGGPLTYTVQHDDSLWAISDGHLHEILSAGQVATAQPQGRNAEIETALEQLLQLNPGFDANPDLIFAGQTVVLNPDPPSR